VTSSWFSYPHWITMHGQPHIRLCNMYCFWVVTVVLLSVFIITLHVHCLRCWNGQHSGRPVTVNSQHPPKKYLYQFPKWEFMLPKKGPVIWNLSLQRTEMNKFLPACHLRRKNYEFSERWSALRGNIWRF